MSLTSTATMIKTNWKDFIIKLLNKYPQIQKKYDEESASLTGIIKVYPPIDNIFRCFDYFNIADTKVVILGQDPYHGPNQAIGLCFGVNTDQKIPPSLRNIEKKNTICHCGSNFRILGKTRSFNVECFFNCST